MLQQIRIIMKFILEKLDDMNKWGHSHSEWSRVRRGLPSTLLADRKAKKYIEKAIKELRNLDFIITLKKTGEIHFSLNPRKKKEIYNFVDKNEVKDYS